MSRSALSTPTATRGWSPWRAVVGFGVVSLAADMVYEGARSVTGPLLASLGASAVLVGLVTGAGEAMALVLRLVFGSMADRTGRYWALTLGGYAMTAVCVPALAVAPLVGGAGLALACVLILAERTGKAVRSPSKSALLAHAAAAVGFGRGFAVHKALDEVGAFAGPLLVAGVTALTGSLWPAMAVLVVPGGVAMVLLLWIRTRVGDGSSYQPLPVAGGEDAPESPLDVPLPPEAPSPPTTALLPAGERLPRRFWLFAASSGAATAGLVTFGVISYHLTRDHVVPLAGVPVVYAAAMAAAAVAALVTGWLYDRWNASCSWPCRCWSSPSRRWRSPGRWSQRSPACWCGEPPSACRTPPSRRSSPSWCRRRDARRRTACSPLCKGAPPSSAGRWPARSPPVGAGPRGRGGRDPGGRAGPAGGDAAAYGGVNLRGCAHVIRVSPWRRPCTGTAAS